MPKEKRTKRRLLSASVGVAAFTAIEGLACGNPIHPRGPDPTMGPDAGAPDPAASTSTTPTDQPDASPEPAKP